MVLYTKVVFRWEGMGIVEVPLQERGRHQQKELKWIKVWLTWKETDTLQHLPKASKASFTMAKEPGRRGVNQRVDKSWYQVEPWTHTKDKSESSADISNLKNHLVDKGLPKTRKGSKKRLDVNLHLQQLKHPQASFTVRYKQPAKLYEAMSATLEMEGYRNWVGL